MEDILKIIKEKELYEKNGWGINLSQTNDVNILNLEVTYSEDKFKKGVVLYQQNIPINLINPDDDDFALLKLKVKLYQQVERDLNIDSILN